MMNDGGFGILILSAGRAGNVITLKTLRDKMGSKLPVAIVCDDEDPALGDYKTAYGDMVRVFHRADYVRMTDRMVCDKDRRAAVYARNAAWDVARDLGWDGFLVLDDDYTDFGVRYIEDGRLRQKRLEHFDEVCSLFDGFLKGCDSRVKTVCFGQGGDHQGGVKDFKRCKQAGVNGRRKAMNSWFLRADRRFDYIGEMNDDITSCIHHGGIGDVFLTSQRVIIEQPQTQKVDGGMSDVYRVTGTYFKSFVSVMARPDAASLAMMGTTSKRIHHHINWRYAVPRIVPMDGGVEDEVPDSEL